MARKAGSNGEETAAAARAAAVKLFAQSGFEAVSMRQLASAIGVRPAALYRYWDTKQELLADVLTGFMDDLLEQLEMRLGTPPHRRRDPKAALEAFVRFHIDAVIAQPDLVFLSYMELRSLNRENFERVAERRSAYEALLAEILTMGAEQGVFAVGHVQVETMALLSMLAGVAGWYHEDGPLEPGEIEEIYIDLVQRAVGARRG